MKEPLVCWTCAYSREFSYPADAGTPQPSDVLHLCTLFQNMEYLYAMFWVHG